MLSMIAACKVKSRWPSYRRPQLCNGCDAEKGVLKDDATTVSKLSGSVDCACAVCSWAVPGNERLLVADEIKDNNEGFEVWLFGKLLRFGKEFRGLKDNAATRIWTNPFESENKLDKAKMRGYAPERLKTTLLMGAAACTRGASVHGAREYDC